MVIQGICLLVLLATAISGYELLEGYYKGEKFLPHQSKANYYGDYSGPGIPNSFAEDAADSQENSDSISGRFSSLIDQLSTVIHSNLQQLTDEQDQQQEDEISPYRGRSFSSLAPRSQANLYYHMYPHYQSKYDLPECATQQVCNAVYLKRKLTQPLCTCPHPQDPCSSSFLSNDDRTLVLRRTPNSKAVTLVKTCENVQTLRDCTQPKDWSILALQNTRTGKAHYLIICKCPNNDKLVGPFNHDQPTYAQVPGIRVYGMMCDYGRRRKRELWPPIPWERLKPILAQEDLL